MKNIKEVEMNNDREREKRNSINPQYMIIYVHIYRDILMSQKTTTTTPKKTHAKKNKKLGRQQKTFSNFKQII